MNTTAATIAIAALAALTPTITVLIGIFLQRQDTRELRGEIAALRTHVDDGFGKINDHLLQFYTITGTLGGRVDEISKRQN